jgi:hypothetical protein
VSSPSAPVGDPLPYVITDSPTTCHNRILPYGFIICAVVVFPGVVEVMMGGIYFCMLQAKDFKATSKLLLLK